MISWMVFALASNPTSAPWPSVPLERISRAMFPVPAASRLARMITLMQSIVPVVGTSAVRA